jgi:hypothetical protein
MGLKYAGAGRCRQDQPALLSDCSLKMTIRSITLLAAAAVAAGYQWPNPRMEAFDFLRWDQAGVHGVVLGQGVVPCNQYVVTPAGNQTNAAQWLRTVSLPLLRVVYSS